MEEKFKRFIEKAERILRENEYHYQPPEYPRERFKDDAALLNRKFRLSRADSEILLKEVYKAGVPQRRKRMPARMIKAFDGGRDFFKS